MRLYRLLPLAVIALAGLSMGAGCPTVPSLKDRVVELALGASTIQTLPTAIGSTNVLDDTGFENLVTAIDLPKVLSDAGIDVTDLQDIKLAGISYRVTVPDPNPLRTITGTTVSAGLGAGPGAGTTPTALITSFSQNVSVASDWAPAPISAAGVTLINGLLTEMVALVKNGTPVSNPVITYHVVGTSTPTGQATNFTWELKLDLTIKGTIKVTVIG